MYVTVLEIVPCPLCINIQRIDMLRLQEVLVRMSIEVSTTTNVATQQADPEATGTVTDLVVSSIRRRRHTAH